MSDIGVHSNVYERVREFGNLVDDVIIALRSGKSSPQDPKRQQLADILVGLASSPPTELPSAWFAMLIGALDPKVGSQWAGVGRALRLQTSDVRIIDRLEELADRLEIRRTEVFAKMSGGG